MVKTVLHSPTPFLDAYMDQSAGWLVLNRPERRNALNGEIWTALPGMVRSIEENPDIRAIVIRGYGQAAFSAGADISEFSEIRNDAASAARYDKMHGEALAAVRQCSKPVVAMIEGICFGGGLALALACDIRIASPSAVFSLPPARLGLAYPLDGLRDLAIAVGAPAAKEMLFTARRVGAEEALRMRLINRIASEAEEETRAVCSEIASGAPLSILHAKRAIDFLTARPGHEDDADIAWHTARCFDSDDYAEGRAAFVEKRQPRFRGS